MSVAVSFVVPSPCNLIQGLSLANTGHKINSQAYHWSTPTPICSLSFFFFPPLPNFTQSLPKKKKKRLVLLSALVERFSVSCMRDFFYRYAYSDFPLRFKAICPKLTRLCLNILFMKVLSLSMQISIFWTKIHRVGACLWKCRRRLGKVQSVLLWRNGSARVQSTFFQAHSGQCAERSSFW